MPMGLCVCWQAGKIVDRKMLVCLWVGGCGCVSVHVCLGV